MSKSLFRLAALSLLLLPGCAAGAAEPIDVVMALPAYSLSFSFEYLAEDLGFYEKHGVRMKQVMLAGVGSINGVISGSADFGVSAGTSLTRAAARGQKLLAIALTIDRPIVQVVLRSDLAKGFDPASPFAKRGLLLKGRTIAVDSIGSLIHAYVRIMAVRAGYNPDDLKIAPMQPPNMEAAFAAHQIDGFAMSPPWPEKPVLEGTAVMIASGPDGEPADYVPFANNVILTKPETCAKRTSVCEAVGQASREGMMYLRDHPADALAVLKKRFSTLDDKLLAASFDVIRKITPMPPFVTAQGLANAERFNVEAGQMKDEEKLKSYDGLFTDAYVR
jgi:ABC-type nitrate/sulfonate/bicarbonate transport system substrate-binding protein